MTDERPHNCAIVSPLMETTGILFKRTVVSRENDEETTIRSDTFRALWNGATVPARAFPEDIDTGASGPIGSIGYTDHGDIISSHKCAGELVGILCRSDNQRVIYAVDVYVN